MDRKQILIIDDDPTVLHFLERKLPEVFDCDVLSARDGTTGLQMADRHRPDLILLDVMMPDQSGGEVASALAAQETLKNIPVVFMTVLLDSAGHKRIELNDQEYRAVAKPVYLPALISQLRKALNEVAN